MTKWQVAGRSALRAGFTVLTLLVFLVRSKAIEHPMVLLQPDNFEYILLVLGLKGAFSYATAKPVDLASK